MNGDGPIGLFLYPGPSRAVLEGLGGVDEGCATGHGFRIILSLLSLPHACGSDPNSQLLLHCMAAFLRPMLPAMMVASSVTLCIRGPQSDAFLCKLLRSWCLFCHSGRKVIKALDNGVFLFSYTTQRVSIVGS